MSDTDTPPFTVARDGKGVSGPLPVLARWITAAAQGADENQTQAIGGVLVERDDNGAIFATATNKYALVRLHCGDMTGLDNGGSRMLLPAKAITAALRAAKPRRKNDNRTARITVTDGRWRLAVSDGSVAEGDAIGVENYPNYRSLLTGLPDTVESAAYSAVTLGVIVGVLDKLGDQATFRWQGMDSRKPGHGTVNGDGVGGVVLVMPVRIAL